MIKLKCEKCGKPMRQVDSYVMEGGFDEGHIKEEMLYNCKDCGQDYLVNIVAQLTESNCEITYFEEA